MVPARDGLASDISSEWSVSDERLEREIRFDTFADAFAFMTLVALAAEKLGHHPDWSNSWNVVRIAVSSHEHGGVTDRCIALAGAIDEAVRRIAHGS